MPRNLEKGMIAGVCAGLSDKMEIDVMWIRLGFVVAFLLWGVGPLLYLILWLIMGTK
jgi:phage shock protein PspC (stress-responsive transcriptional regulator)